MQIIFILAKLSVQSDCAFTKVFELEINFFVPKRAHKAK